MKMNNTSSKKAKPPFSLKFEAHDSNGHFLESPLMNLICKSLIKSYNSVILIFFFFVIFEFELRWRSDGEFEPRILPYNSNKICFYYNQLHIPPNKIHALGSTFCIYGAYRKRAFEWIKKLT